MTKKHCWQTLNVLAFVSLWLSSGCIPSKPVAFASKTSPDGEWSVTLWKGPGSSVEAWAEVHDSTLDRTARVALGDFEDWSEPDWCYSKIDMDGESAALGSLETYERWKETPDRWIRVRIVRRDVFAEKPPRYSAEFQVESEFPETIQIVGWSDEFGKARPPKGEIAPRGARARSYHSRYQSLEQVPDSISVEWYPESDPGHHRRQTISVAGVIPLGEKGRTAFHLDREGEWSVRFEPEE